MITEEYQDDNFSVEDFQKELSTADSINEGYDGVNFHYLIRKDGTIQRGRPIDIEPKQPGSEFNIEKSLIVAISAGYDAPFGTEGAELSFKLSSNLSLQLWLFLDVVFRMFPGLPIFADEILVNIGFDVESYILSGWGKYNPNVTRPSNTLSALNRSFVVLAKAKED